MADEEELRVCSAGESPRSAKWVGDTRYLRRLSFASFSSRNSVSGHGALGSEERMRDSSTSISVPSLVTDLYCTPSSNRSHLFLPSTAGDFSSGTSLSISVRPGEVPSTEYPLVLCWHSCQEILGNGCYVICFVSGF